MLRKPLITSLLFVAALSTGACQDDSSEVAGPAAAGKGLTVWLTDAPGDFKAAVVTISEIYLQGQGGRVVLLDDPFTADLLTLQNAVATLASGLDVPAGSYSQLRLVLTGAYIEVEQQGGGTRIFASSPNYAGIPAGKTANGTLHMPSMGSSGLKIDLPGGKLDVGEDQTIVLIDFDVKESFGHEAGNSGRWILNPKITATNVTFGGNFVARLQLGTGVVLPPIAGQIVTLASFTARLVPVGGGAARTVVFTDANNDGIFEAMFTGIVPGQYTLDFLIPTGLLGTFAPLLPLTVTVTANQTATQIITLSTAAAASSIVATLKLNTGVTLPPVAGTATTLSQFRAQLTPPAGSPIVVNFTDANNDGTFEAAFNNLLAGNYSLTILRPAGTTITYSPTVPVAITLAAGTTNTTALIVTAATAP